jgi:hypothetical protein
LTLPRFDKQTSKDVLIDEGARRASFGETPESKAKKSERSPNYPSTDLDTAYVAPTSCSSSGNACDATTVVHFLIDCEPSTCSAACSRQGTSR